MQQVFELFQREFPTMKTGITLSSLTSFQVGGPADLYFELKETDALPGLLIQAEKAKIPVIILGGGTNIIFSEKGFRGLVIHLKNKRIEVEDRTIIAEAGAPLSKIIQVSNDHGLSGMEKLMGLPGTIGGAVRGNAGAYGVEIKDFFEKALLYNSEKGFFELGKQSMHFEYRESVIKHSHDIVLKVWLTLKKSEGNQGVHEAVEILKNRAGKQPSGKCSGSFFKNPVDGILQKNSFTVSEESPVPKSAGYLLDQVGCKGLKVGGAQVSEKHANWLINVGNATLEDVRSLSEMMKKRVFERFGITLEREVQLIDEGGFLP